MNKMAAYQTDLGVNANILFYSGLCSKKQPDIIKSIKSIVRKRKYENLSIYTLSDYPIIYLITRAYKDANIKDLKSSMPRIIKHLIHKQNNNGFWGEEHETALATISLLNAGCKSKYLENPIKYILKTQQENGSWRARTFFQDFTPTYYGSEELTTAFCIEALIKYSMTTIYRK